MIVDIFDETDKLSEELRNIIIETAKVCALSEGINKNCTVDILITDDENIRQINKTRRKLDKATDVLSFPMLNYKKDTLPVENGVFIGDLVISIDKIFAQAEEYGHGANREAGFLTAHGMLHLLGYDHVDPAGEKEMFLKQEIIMKKLGLER